MTDIAALSFAVDSSQLPQAVQHLDAVDKSSAAAATSSDRLKISWQATTASVAAFRQGLQDIATTGAQTVTVLDAVMSKVDAMRAKFMYGGGGFGDFETARKQVEALGVAFDQSSVSMEAYYRKSVDLHMGADLTVSSLQRITSALKEQGAQAQITRQMLTDMGVTITGKGPADAASTLASTVKALQGYRQDAAGFQAAQQTLGPMSSDDYAAMMQPKYVSIEQTRQRATAQITGAEINTNLRSAGMRQQEQTQQQAAYVDQSSEYNVYAEAFRDAKTRIGSTLPSDSNYAKYGPDSISGQRDILQYLTDHPDSYDARLARRGPAQVARDVRGSAAGRWYTNAQQGGVMQSRQTLIDTQWQTDSDQAGGWWGRRGADLTHAGRSMSNALNQFDVPESWQQQDNRPEAPNQFVESSKVSLNQTIAAQTSLQSVVSMGSGKVAEMTTYWEAYNAALANTKPAEAAQIAINAVMSLQARMKTQADELVHSLTLQNQQISLVVAASSASATDPLANLSGAYSQTIVNETLNKRSQNPMLSNQDLSAYQQQQATQLSNQAAANEAAQANSALVQLTTSKELLSVAGQRGDVQATMARNAALEAGYVDNISKAMAADKLAGPGVHFNLDNAMEALQRLKEIKTSMTEIDQMRVSINLTQGMNERIASNTVLAGQTPGVRRTVEQAVPLLQQNPLFQGMTPAELTSAVGAASRGDFKDPAWTGLNVPGAGGTVSPATAGRWTGAGGATVSPPSEYMPYYQEASKRTGIPAEILIAKDKQESGFNPNLRGSSGDIGLGQTMPSTARAPGYGMTGVDPESLWDPRANINFNADYLKARGGAGTDWTNPAQIASALQQYNNGGNMRIGDPQYAAHVMRYLPAGGVTAQTPGDARQAAITAALGVNASNESLAATSASEQANARLAMEARAAEMERTDPQGAARLRATYVPPGATPAQLVQATAAGAQYDIGIRSASGATFGRTDVSMRGDVMMSGAYATRSQAAVVGAGISTQVAGEVRGGQIGASDTSLRSMQLLDSQVTSTTANLSKQADQMRLASNDSDKLAASWKGGADAAQNMQSQLKVDAYQRTIDALQQLSGGSTKVAADLAAAKAALAGFQEQSKHEVVAAQVAKTAEGNNQMQEDIIKAQASANLPFFAGPRTVAAANAQQSYESWARTNKTAVDTWNSGATNDQGVRQGLDPEAQKSLFMNHETNMQMAQDQATIRAGWSQMADTAANAFSNAVMNGTKMRDVVAGLSKDLASMLLKNYVEKPIFNAVGDATSSALGFGTSATSGAKTSSGGTSGAGLFGAIGSGIMSLVGMLGFGNSVSSVSDTGVTSTLDTNVIGVSAGSGITDILKGGYHSAASGAVYANGYRTMFGSGGLISTPTTLMMASGGTGLAGEAGTEAIVPLKRDASGNLGVSMSGADSGGVTVHMGAVTINNPQVSQSGLDKKTMDAVNAHLAQTAVTAVKSVMVNESRPGGILWR